MPSGRDGGGAGASGVWPGPGVAGGAAIRRAARHSGGGIVKRALRIGKSRMGWLVMLDSSKTLVSKSASGAPVRRAGRSLQPTGKRVSKHSAFGPSGDGGAICRTQRVSPLCEAVRGGGKALDKR
jgi:hypothetical protein